MEIRDYAPFDRDELLKLYASDRLTRYTERPDDLREAFARSLCVLAAYDGGKLMGLIRAVGDGRFIAVVQDLLVFPEYRRQGVGTALMRALMERCHYPDVYIGLLTDDRPELNAFFRDALDGVEPAYYACKAYVWM